MRIRTWLARRPALAAAGLYALLALLLFSHSLGPGRTQAASDYLYSAAPWEAQRPDGVRGLGANYETLDQSLQFLPFFEYIGAQGRIPLWNPHIMGGRTFIGNAQHQLFSPFTLPTYVLGLWSSLVWASFLKVFVAAFGTFLLARALAMRYAGCLLAGLVFGFGLFFVVWVPWPVAGVFAFIPWLLLTTDRVVRRPGVLSVAALAVVVGLTYFGGHPESSFHALFGALAFLALRLWQVRSGRLEAHGGWGRGLLCGAGALLIGSALAAVAIVPFVEALLQSADLGRRDEAVKVQLRYISALVLPDYYGRPTQLALEGLIVERAFYVGALTLLLAAAALIVRPTLERVAVAGLGLFSLLMVFAVEPVFSAARLLPGFGTVHNTRLTILFLLSAALLAGWGLDELTSAGSKLRRRRAVLAVAIVALLAPLLWILGAGRAPLDVLDDGLRVAWGFESPGLVPERAQPVLAASSLIVWVSFASAALALLALRSRGRMPATAFAVAAVALIALDLFRAGMGQNPGIPTDHARQPATGALRYLQARTPARFVGADPVDPRGGIPPPVTPNTSMRYGLYDARGYDFPIEQRYDRLWQDSVQRLEGFTIHTERAPIDERSLRALSLLGVADVIQRPEDPPLRYAGLELAYEGRDARVYANERALPRALVVASQREVSGSDAALRAVTSPFFDGREEVIVERRVPGLAVSPGELPSALARPRPPAAGAARIASYEPERVELRATAARPSLLVLNDVHFPGWKAELDGREVPIERVNFLMRGVRLPAGTHRVVMRYEPASYRAGLLVSLLALVGLAGAVAADLVRRRRGRPPTPRGARA